jgi:hypothetical protein
MSWIGSADIEAISPSAVSKEAESYLIAVLAGKMKHRAGFAYYSIGAFMWIRRIRFLILLFFMAAASQAGTCLEVVHHDDDEHCFSYENRPCVALRTPVIRKSLPLKKSAYPHPILRQNLSGKAASKSVDHAKASPQQFRVLLI